MANDIIFKEELGDAINTIVGETPKTLPAVLNKGDIVKYGNYLYKYKGENGVRKELVDEGSFKKVGLRYRENGFKYEFLDTMETLYKMMYENGLNGDNQKRTWNSPRISTYYSFNAKDFTNIRIYDNSSYSTTWRLGELINTLKKYAKSENIEDIIEFPFKLSTDTITLSNLSSKERISYEIYYLKDIKLKPEIFNKAIMLEFEKIKEYMLNPNISINPSDFVYFDVTRQSRIQTYETPYYYNESLDKDYFIKKLIDNDNFKFGVYQYTKFLNFGVNNEIINTRLDYHTETHSGENSTSYTRRMYIKFESLKIINSGKPVDRFWLPYFNDMIGYDYAGKSARLLNEKFNKYGVYFKLEEEGKYTFKFKMIFTDRNQHEESGTKGPWGARYSYYLNATDVRGDGDTYCRWQPKQVDTDLNFTINNGEIIDVSINFSEETRETNRFKDEFNITGYEFKNKILYIKMFYAIWSYDDAGDWNEWQFAHIIPPFSLEYKGE